MGRDPDPIAAPRDDHSGRHQAIDQGVVPSLLPVVTERMPDRCAGSSDERTRSPSGRPAISRSSRSRSVPRWSRRRSPAAARRSAPGRSGSDRTGRPRGTGRPPVSTRSGRGVDRCRHAGPASPVRSDLGQGAIRDIQHGGPGHRHQPLVGTGDQDIDPRGHRVDRQLAEALDGIDDGQGTHPAAEPAELQEDRSDGRSASARGSPPRRGSVPVERLPEPAQVEVPVHRDALHLDAAAGQVERGIEHPGELVGRHDEVVARAPVDAVQDPGNPDRWWWGRRPRRWQELRAGPRAWCGAAAVS